MESINDPWEVKASKSTELKDGSYIAEFIGVEDFSHDRIDGLRWKWSFKVVTGIELGKMADALTEQNITATVGAGRIIAGLLNREIKVGDKVQDLVNACKSKRYLITYGRGSKGGKSAVRSVGEVPDMG